MRSSLRNLVVAVAVLTASQAHAAIGFRGGQTGQFAGKTTETTVTFALSGGSGATPQADDIVICFYSVGAGEDIALYIRNGSAVDYTTVGSELYANDAFDANVLVGYRIMPGTPETTLVLSGTTSNQNAGSYAILVFSGVDTSTPMDVTPVTATGIDTRLANPSSITPTTSGAYVAAGGGGAAGSITTNYTSSDLTGFISTRQSDTNDSVVGAGYYAWTSGAFDPAQFGGAATDTTDDSWGAATIALRPSGGGGGCTAGVDLTLLGVGGCR